MHSVLSVLRAAHPLRLLRPLPVESVCSRVLRSSSTARRPEPSESFVNNENGAYLESLFEKFEADPKSVPVEWAAFCGNVQQNVEPGNALVTHRPVVSAGGSGGTPGVAAVASEGEVLEHVRDTARLMTMLRMYRVRGHLASKLDPLNLNASSRIVPELDPKVYGFGEADLDRSFFLPKISFVGDANPARPFERIRLRDLVSRFEDYYCGNFGVEFYHIHDAKQRDWLQSRLESDRVPLTREQKLWIYRRLYRAEKFELFLATKFSGAKRFGIEGGEALLPIVDAALERATELGVKSVVMGMPHRGRLNILTSVMEKEPRRIFHEFEGSAVPRSQGHVLGSGDVKYHLGCVVDRVLQNGQTVSLTLCANPSHLEAVNAVVEGRARCQQWLLNDETRKHVMCLTMHGDAAFAGQGVVAESISFSGLKFFKTGGTVHVIVNNQIGFTTDPLFARSSPYPSDIAKAVGAPIFHVNGDKPEEVYRLARLAVEWRQQFGADVVLDLVCYRRHGHNEGDAPMYTQPHMYKKIAKQESVCKLYRRELVSSGIPESELAAMEDEYTRFLEAEFEASQTLRGDVQDHKEDWSSRPFRPFLRVTEATAREEPTGVAHDDLVAIGKSITTIPENFNLHPNLQRIIVKERRRMIEEGKRLDWGMAEHLAFGSLLREGTSVRMSGQDVERGTFSHRHAVLHDQNERGRIHIPLNDACKNADTKFVIANSHLSEFAVLGFEYGTSIESPHHLAIWEAQFGDFANGAQVIIDQFVSSGESKWFTQSGLVMLLPHGYDGQGPEHSSCRLERFLQMSSEASNQFRSNEVAQLRANNMQVAMLSSPAQFFHILRRQMRRNFRKPLVLAVSKSLLRLPEAACSLDDLLPGTSFQWVLPEAHEDELRERSKIERLIFVSGQLYYTLLKERRAGKLDHTAIVRVEQLAPFPFARVADELKKYPNAKLVVAQDEPHNMGWFSYAEPRFHTALRELNDSRASPVYVGRPSSASPATGWMVEHKRELAAILKDAFHLG